MPTVSVIMPCYNHEKYVGEAIKSVLDQSYTDFDFLIVDNGCTDNSYEVIKSFDDVRIKVFRLEKNDLEKASRILWENWTGKYIAFMCSDDVWEKSKLEKQMKILEEKSDVLLTATWAIFTDEGMNTLEWSKGVFQKENRSRLEWIRYLLENGNCLSAPSVVAENTLYKDVFCKSYGYWQLSDYYSWLIALKRTNIYMIEEVLVKQRFHSTINNSNVSYPNEENLIRTKIETSKILLQMIETLEDTDFLEMYKDKLVNKNVSTHLEIICEKFFILLEYARKDSIYEENVLYFFYKYYAYEENGISISKILKEKYKYSYMNFREVSATMGIAARNIKYEKQIEYLKKKIRNLLPIKEKKILKNVNEELKVCLMKLKRGYFNEELFEIIVSDLENILLIWDWLNYIEIEIKREELELCKRLCLIYQKNLEMVDGNELYTNILRYQEAIQKLIVC